MSVKNRLDGLVRRSARISATSAENELRDHRNLEIVLSAALHGSDAPALIHYPVAYVDFLRSCMESAPHDVKEIKASADAPDDASRRFTNLVQELRWGAPPVEFSVAKEIALIADNNRELSDSHAFAQWVGDVGLYFSMSSSFGSKGRILFNVVRFMRSENCLELGTAFGMSALFILAALKKYSKSGHLTTLEGFEPQFSLSSSLLKGRYGDAVTCEFGKIAKALPEIVDSVGTLDFMFHDCSHSREDYIHDFNEVIKSLAPGAVVLFDDIRWEDLRIIAGGAHTYEGWQAVVANPRVKRAVEIDGSLGLLLMGT